MSYSLVELVFFILAFLAGYYAIAHWTSTGTTY
jgi:hypothetical protein